MKAIRTILHAEEPESFMETFLDVLLCGLGAALALMIVYSVLPKGGRAAENAMANSASSALPIVSNGASTAGNAAPVFVIKASVESDPQGLSDGWSGDQIVPPPSAEAFKIFPANAGSLSDMERFQTHADVGKHYGFEAVFRLNPQPIVLAIDKSLVKSQPTSINIKLFINGFVRDYSLDVSSLPSGFAVKSSDMKFTRLEHLVEVSDSYIGLFEITPLGEIIGPKTGSD